MEIFLQILYTVLVLGALILFHELGHFVTAKIFGVRVNEFAIGMGPKLISWKDGKFSSFFTKKSDVAENEGTTRYSIRLLPIGGFVNLEGEDAPESGEPRPDALYAKPAWQRLIILFAGGFMNLVVAFILTLILSTQSYVMTTQIGGFRDDALSSQSGLRIEDTIVRVGEVDIDSFSDLSYAFQSLLEKDSADLVVLRDGERVELHGVKFPFAYLSTGELVTEETEAKYAAEGKTMAKMMVPDFKVYGTTPTAADVLPVTFRTMWSNIKLVYGTLFDLITGKLSAQYVSGPIGISGAVKQAVDSGPETVLNLAALVSVNLGLVNLLPLPALDGGRGAFALLEIIRRKRINPKVEATVHSVGMIVLLALIAVIAVKDLFFPVL